MPQPRRPRRQPEPPPITPAEREAQAQRRRDAEVAAAAAAVGTAAAAAHTPTGLEVPAAAARAAAHAAVMAGLVGFLSQSGEQARGWLQTNLPRRRGAMPDDIANAIAEEHDREAAFARLSAERVARDLPLVLAIPDPARREGAIRGLMRREQTYHRFHMEAVAARSIAAVDRAVLRRESPSGAYWKSDPTVVEHTAGCLVMSGGGRGRGRFWPWAVLDRVHPPRHAGCPCRLHSYGDAIAHGWLNPADILDVSAAIRAASGIVMEANEAEAVATQHDLVELREAAEQLGVASVEQFNDAVARLYEGDAIVRAPFV